jgi:hypothetical protein
MSTLRQAKKETTEGDVEAQPLVGSSTLPKSAIPGAGHNPILLAKIIFRKVVDLMVASEEDDLSQPGGIITLLKDVIIGVILGVLAMSCLIFLDHRNIVHLQSAHNFRNAAFRLLNDPETIATIEESSDLKFMLVEEYESQRKEISEVDEKLASKKEMLEKRIAEAAEKQKEIDEIKPTYDSLVNNPILELDKYCGGCTWGMGKSCDGRVQFLKETYNTKPIEAKISAMGHASCKTA